jgi:hypothetical protein
MARDGDAPLLGWVDELAMVTLDRAKNPSVLFTSFMASGTFMPQ